jgi:hypothetical protein
MWRWISQMGLALGLMWMGWDMAHAQTTPLPTQLYTQHCAACHGGERQGSMGPALMPESLERLKQKDAIRSSAKAAPPRRCPPLQTSSSSAEIERWPSGSTAHKSRAPIGPRPTSAHRAPKQADGPSGPPSPQWKADPLNLFVVVEGGDHHVSLLDGDRFKVIHRFASRFALHGGPKFSPDGRYVYFGSRDGWITKYDLYNLKVVARCAQASTCAMWPYRVMGAM